jgi:hypothetical protein
MPDDYKGTLFRKIEWEIINRPAKKKVSFLFVGFLKNNTLKGKTAFGPILVFSIYPKAIK